MPKTERRAEKLRCCNATEKGPCSLLSSVPGPFPRMRMTTESHEGSLKTREQTRSEVDVLGSSSFGPLTCRGLFQGSIPDFILVDLYYIYIL